MLTKKSSLLFLVLVTAIFGVAGQEAENPHNFAKMTDFLPPAPNAASIVKYGGLAINKNSGAPNINIPITEVASKRLKTGISLGYSSSGLKVDEIASRVGMGWTILSGGVITRTVRGAPDDENTRLLPYAPVGFNMQTYTYMNKIANSYTGGYDSEPDLFNFNFNGISGSFVFDEGMNIVPIEPNNFKYAYNFTSTNWNFKITTGDGTEYYFGGSAATEKTKRDQVCGKLYNYYIATSWYLKEIVHPNGDKIIFGYIPHEYTYDNGVSQTMYYTPAVPPSDGAGIVLGTCEEVICQSPQNTTCINLVRTQGVLLQSITAPQHQRVVFEYVSRNDCYDKLISKITLFDIKGTATPVKVWNLKYNEVMFTGRSAALYAFGQNKTYYLVSIMERSPDSTQFMEHGFAYIDPANRPHRLSYAQDHWGYYNGKNNSTLIPKPATLTEQMNFPTATANRKPDGQYAVNGLLCKVLYPTGGIDSIIYESNNIYKSKAFYPRHTQFMKATGTGFSTSVYKETTFSIDNRQVIRVDISVADNSGSGDFDPLHNKGTVQIKSSSPSATYLNKVWTPGTSGTEFVELEPGTYTLSVRANGSVVTTRATMQFAPNTVNNMDNYEIGGMRVKAVFTAAHDEKPIIKRYYYGSITTLDNSSLSEMPDPVYLKFYKTRMICFALNKYFYLYCDHKAVYSNSLNSLFDFLSTSVSYASVVESNGDNMANGGIETKFYSSTDATGQVVWGEPLLNAPKSNSTSLLNGKVKEETIYKQTSNKTLLPLKKTLNSYKLDTRINKTIHGYTINQKYANNIVIDTTCDISTNAECMLRLTQNLDAFDMTRYDILCRWVYTDTTTEITYDEDGNNPITSKTIYYFNDTRNLQVSKTETYDSKGNLVTTEFRYPHDFAGTAVYDSMVNRNIISPLINAKNFVAGTKMTETNAVYANWGNGNFAPSSIQKSNLSNPPDTEGQILKYDRNGNILEFKGRDGILTAIIYGYNNLYPVAKVTGASYNTAIAQLSVDTGQLQTLTGTALLQQLDRIRTNLTAAQVTTFAYTPTGNISSVTDINNNKTQYEYDALYRLKHVRDLDSNIIQKTEYRYAQPNNSARINIFFNSQRSQALYPQNCSAGFMAKAVTYTVPAGKYFSTISQADADAKAQYEITTKAQAYANAYGECTVTCEACTGAGYKCINEVCEAGTLVYVSSVWDGTNWVCTFYYTFSDGSKSQNFTITSSTYCGFD